MRNEILKELYQSLGVESAEVDMTAEDPGILEYETGSAQTIEDVEEDKVTEEVIDASLEPIEDAEVVEDLVAVVEHAQATSGHLTRFEAAALKLTFNQVGNKYFKDPIAQLPATESANGMGSYELTLASESLKESATNIFKQTYEMLKKIFEKVVDFFSRLINKQKWLAKRAAKLAEAVRGKTEWVEGTTNVNAKYLAQNGKVSDDIIEKFMSALLPLYMISNSSSLGLDLGWLEEILANLKKMGGEGSGDEKVVLDENHGAFNKMFSDINSRVVKQFQEASKDFEVRSGGSKIVPSNIKQWAEIPGNMYFGYGTIAEKNIYKPMIGKLEQEADLDEVKTNIPFATKEQAIELSTGCVKAAKDLTLKMSKNLQKWQQNKTFKNLQANSGNADTRQNSTDKESLKIMVEYIKAVTSFNVGLDNMLHYFLLGVIEWLEASVKGEAIEGQAE